MIVVVGSRHDPAAARFVSACPPGGAALLDAPDLSAPGWELHLDRPARWRGSVAGAAVDARSVSGVLVRRPAVYAAELDHIVEGDRIFVAAEMTAFLRCWLGLLRVPVLNPPSQVCLGGRGWQPVRWMAAAAAAGLGSAAAVDAPWTVTLAAGAVVGEVLPRVRARVESLARAAGTPLVAVTLDGDPLSPTFVAADPWPDPTTPGVFEAVCGALS